MLLSANPLKSVRPVKGILMEIQYYFFLLKVTLRLDIVPTTLRKLNYLLISLDENGTINY